MEPGSIISRRTNPCHQGRSAALFHNHETALGVGYDGVIARPGRHPGHDRQRAFSFYEPALKAYFRADYHWLSVTDFALRSVRPRAL